jgi:hypothetical protein
VLKVRLFGLFGRNRIKPLWQYRSTGLLWHVRPASLEVLVGEERDPDRKEATFFSINRVTGRVHWRDKQFGDSWWTGIEAVQGDVLLVHGFATPSMPQHRGLIAIDLFSGRELWKRDDVQYAALASNEVRVIDADRNSECSLDLHTGEQRGGMGDLPENLPAGSQESMIFPVPLEFVHRQNPQLGSNVQALLAEIRTVGPIDVAEHGNLYVVNFHENRNASDSGRPLMNNVLVVVDRKRQKVVFSTVLDEALRQLVPESFFIHGNLLFCIAGRHTLLALPLSQDDDRTALT